MDERETTIHALINSREESSLLVANDLAIELNCGLPVSVKRRYISTPYYKSTAGINNIQGTLVHADHFGIVGKQKIARSMVGELWNYGYSSYPFFGQAYYRNPIFRREGFDQWSE